MLIIWHFFCHKESLNAKVLVVTVRKGAPTLSIGGALEDRNQFYEQNIPEGNSSSLHLHSPLLSVFSVRNQENPIYRGH